MVTSDYMTTGVITTPDTTTSEYMKTGVITTPDATQTPAVTGGSLAPAAIGATADWPDSLPCILRDGHSTQHGTPFIRTQLDSGRARQRRAFMSVPSVKQVQWIFTASECAIFEAWFRDSINDGADWFNMTMRTPLGINTPTVCRFTKMYEGPDIEAADSWRVTAELELWERPLLPGGWIQYPEWVQYANIFDIAMNQKWPSA